jgi:hypothetical protein
MEVGHDPTPIFCVSHQLTAWESAKS